MLCEIFWEKNAFKEADALLAAAPQDLADSVAMYLLRGQTLFHAQKYQEAKLHYQNFLENYGWNELVVKALAATHETLGELADARDRYGDIMAQCQSCRASVDPYVKLKYADMCFFSGLYTTEILELYLTLAREIPANAADCFKKISRIYSARGNETEAKRYRLIAEKFEP